MEGLVQIAGALLVLAAFVLSQLRLVAPASLAYLVPNVVGSAVLALVALRGSEWGFLLLEGVWALVSAAGVAAALRRPDAPTPRL